MGPAVSAAAVPGLAAWQPVDPPLGVAAVVMVGADGAGRATFILADERHGFHAAAPHPVTLALALDALAAATF